MIQESFDFFTSEAFQHEVHTGKLYNSNITIASKV